MKFSIYKRKPCKFLEPKYFSRYEDGSFITMGYTKKGMIRATKREIMKSVELVGIYKI